MINDAAVSLLAGANVLSVEAVDAANNAVTHQATLQVNYNTTLEFPQDGQPVNPLLPLSFAFQVNDACLPQGWYGGASADLWLISPSGQEQPAEWYGIATGNNFVLNNLTGWYEFDADLTGLMPGVWTARADLDDGTSRSVTFVIPAAGPNGQGTPTLSPNPRPSPQPSPWEREGVEVEGRALPLAGRGWMGWPTFDCTADLARNGRYLGGCR